MAQITRLQSALLAKILGLREGVGPGELSDIILPVLSIEPYLLTQLEGASPAPTTLRGLERPPIKITTGNFAAALGLNRGIFEVFGGALVGGTDRPTKDTNYANPPNREWEIWGYSFFIAHARGGISESGFILSTERVSPFTFDGPELLHAAEDLHSQNAWNKTTDHIWFTQPYVIPPDTELTWEYTVLTIGAAINAEVSMRLYWKYA